MDWRPHIRACLGDGTGDPARDAEVVEELAQHLWDRCDDLRRRGLTAADAEATILAELRADDNLADRLRASDRRRPLAPPPPLPGGSSMTRDLWQDLRHAARMLARCPAFTIASLVTLALGIGMTTAIFSVVDAVLMRPVPFPEPHRLVMVWETDRSSGTSHEPASWPDLQDFRQRSRRLERLEALVPTEVTLTPEGAEPTRAAALAVTSRLLPMLGVTPVLGRTFRSEEEASDADGVLISDALWERAFRRDPRAVGHTLRLDDRPRTVVGVLPAGADFGVAQVLAAADYGRGFVDRDAATRVDIWMPMPAQARQLPSDTHPLLMLGRLAAGATVASAQEELAGIAADLEKAYLLPRRARGARRWPPLRRPRRDQGAGGGAGERGGGGALLPGPRSHRSAARVLGYDAHHRRRAGERTLLRHRRGAADRGLHAARADAVDRGRGCAPRPDRG